AWTITATAYTKAPPTVAAAWGSAETTIKPEGNSTVPITLAPYTGKDAAPGKLRYAIGIGGDGGAIDRTGLSSAKITVTKINADGTDGEPAATNLSWSVDT
ncbi:hypothetical protein, partial [Treponema primitia]|uniref:hypothetical protein n=1 Tax=Treponema primitia TaxID=88058 RepID=UPI0002555458